MKSVFLSVYTFTKKVFRNIIFQAVSLFILLVGMGVTYAAWTTITASQWADGQPVTQTLMQGMINNLNDLNTRVSNITTTAGFIPGSVMAWCNKEYAVQGQCWGWATSAIPYGLCPSWTTRRWTSMIADWNGGNIEGSFICIKN